MNLILFDGVCNLCNSTVYFIIRRDPKGKFKFASLQSEVGQSFMKRLKIPSKEIDSIVYLKDDRYFIKSTAVLNILKDLGGFWKTTDAGRSLEPLFDKEGTQSIGSFAVAPSNQEIIYVGTGESNIFRASLPGLRP